MAPVEVRGEAPAVREVVGVVSDPVGLAVGDQEVRVVADQIQRTS